MFWLICKQSFYGARTLTFMMLNLEISQAIIFPWSQLLQREANKRLGSRSGPGSSGNEIENHKWFKSITWKKLMQREIRPSVSGHGCISNFDE
ncbi:unnamed protein product [Musa acuminata subsp. malaccensis]|uniref:(wild Malaysian banana) hypothetical protein n=1 Tax=Musa acuminata subsp. malaccensis TaxID=214687 RepID=A0A804LB26_MUSAM|nr:unnamed protein product [Musa acuminata subsp. malaccensis]